MWKCPKCKREFLREKQAHSCRTYPLEKHFENKEHARELYDELLSKLKKELSSFKIESVPCCIHFVTGSIFAAVWPMKGGIRADFKLPAEVKSPRLFKTIRLSKNAYMHYIDIKDEKEIDRELIGWIKESYQKSI